VARGLRPDRLRLFRTSGSTGEPLSIRSTWLEDRVSVAVRLRALRAFGLSVGDRRVVVGMAAGPGASRLRSMLGLFPWVALEGLRPPAEILDALHALAPDVILGYPGVLHAVAGLILDGPGSVPRPKLVVAAGEVLTAEMRGRIAAAFGSRVFELYTSHELHTIGWECMETGALHVADDSVVVEVLRDGRPVGAGETGQLVGTALHSFAMPFLRYRLGDMVTRGTTPCRCGQPFSTIESVQGRMVDYLVLPGGRLLHPYRLTVRGTRCPWVRQQQVTQEREDRIVLRVVPRGTPPREELAQAEAEARATLGPGVDFRLLLVPEIPLDGSGKFHYCRSFVRSAYGDLTPSRHE
jgi:phenylacetate-CoA ligase